MSILQRIRNAFLPSWARSPAALQTTSTELATRTAPSPTLAPVVLGPSAVDQGLKAPSSFDDYYSIYGGNGPRLVYACVSAIAADVAAIPIRAIETTSKDETAFPHMALDAPNPEDTLPDLIEHAVIDLELTANAFLFMDDSAEMFRIPSNEVRIYPGEDGYVRQYGVDRGGWEKLLPAESVRHIKLPNPSNRYWGTGPSQALQHTMVISRGEDLYLLRFYKNGARPSGFISFSPEAHEAEVATALERFNEKHGGAENHGGTGALLGGAKFEHTSFSPVEGGYVEVQKISEQEFVTGYNVPPFRLGILDKANYANAREQERIYMTTNILVMMRRIVRGLNHWPVLVPDPKRVMLATNEQLILEQFRDEESIARASEIILRAGLMPRDAVREKFYRLPPIDDDEVPQWGSLPMRLGAAAAGVVPLPSQVDDQDDDAPTPAPEDNAEAVSPATALNGAQVQALMEIVQAVAAGEIPRATGIALIVAAFPIDEATAEKIMGDVGKGFVPASEGDNQGGGQDDERRVPVNIPMAGLVRAAYERNIDIRRTRQEEELAAVVAPTLANIAAQIMDVVNRYRSATPKTRQDDHGLPPELVEALRSLDFSQWTGEILDQWIPEIARILLEEGEIKIALTGLEAEAFNLQDPAVLEFVETIAADLVRHVEENTKEEIRRLTAESLAEGESVDELAKRFESSPEIGNDRVRAQRIAQTESAAAAGFGSQNAYEQAEDQGVVLQKRWLTVGDENVRESHAANERQGPIPVRATYVNGMRYPGDPLAPAGERINERCDQVPVVEE